MKDFKKVVALGSATAVAAALLCAAVVKTNSSKVSKTQASTFSIALNSGSSIEWDGVNGSTTARFTNFEIKSGTTLAGGFCKLNKTLAGTSEGNDAYIGNTTAITAIESISVVYTGTYMSFYGSPDGTTYYRVQTVGSSTNTEHSETLTSLNNYNYFRACSGLVSTGTIDVTSLTINYGCDKDESTERMDLTNHINLSDYTFASYDTNYKHGSFSSRSLKVLKGSDGEITWDLPFVLTPEMLKHYTFHFDLYYDMYQTTDYIDNGDGTYSVQDGATVTQRDYYMPWQIATKYNGSTKNYKAFNDNTRAVTWGSKSTNLGDVYKTELSDSNINQIGFKFNSPLNSVSGGKYYYGSVYFDNFYLVELPTYPEISATKVYETSDVSSGTFSLNGGEAGYVNETKTDYYVFGESNEASHITFTDNASQAYRFGYSLEAGRKTSDVVDRNTILRFDFAYIVNAARAAQSKDAHIYFYIAHESSVYQSHDIYNTSLAYTEVTQTVVNYPNSTSLNWYSLELDIAGLMDNPNQTYAYPSKSYYLGFYIQYASDFYLDNMFYGTLQYQ